MIKKIKDLYSFRDASECDGRCISGIKLMDLYKVFNGLYH